MKINDENFIVYSYDRSYAILYHPKTQLIMGKKTTFIKGYTS
jgi:hypothetical protein